MNFWFSEKHTKDVKLSIRIDKQVYSGKSDYQRIDVFDTPAFGRMLVLAQEGGPAVLVGGGAVRPLAENAGPTGCYLPAERKFLLAVEYKDAVNLDQLPHSTRPESSVSPGRLKPENRNSIYRLLPRSGGESPEAVLIDHRGNVSILRILPRRWRKQPVYEVPEG